jgi:nucleoside-diphosphate-sugar epimerase
MYHLACPTRDEYEEDPIQALESCFIGTKNLLDVALRYNARVVLAHYSTAKQASARQPGQGTWDDRLRRKRKRSVEATDAVSQPTKRRRTQRMSVPVTSTSFYDEGNRLAEMLCSAYQQHFGLEVRIARLPASHHPSLSKSNDGSSRVLELIAPTDIVGIHSADTTLVGATADDGVLSGLINLMEAPGPARAGTSEADQVKTSGPAA